MKRVYLESPFALDGNYQRNIKYLRACMNDSLQRGEAPFAAHALYTQRGVLDDNHPEERKWGMETGFKWAEYAESSVFYIDLVVSSGMMEGMLRSLKEKRPHELRMLGDDWEKKFDDIIAKNPNHPFAKNGISM